MAILDFLFPKKCFGCQKIGYWLCPSCLKKIKPLQRQTCPVCCQPSFWGLTHPYHRRQVDLNGLLILFSYQPPLNIMMRDYKYQLVSQIEEAWSHLVKIGLEFNRDLVNYWQKEQFVLIPVPLFPTRLKWRGFNQLTSIVKQIASCFQIPVDTQLIRRVRWTRSQASLDQEKRKTNLKEAFAISSLAKIKNKNFLIFDDVWTTGTTLRTIARLLKQNGARKVWGLTILG